MSKSKGHEEKVKNFKRPEDLTLAELVRLARAVQEALYLDKSGQGDGDAIPEGVHFWNPDNEWSGADVCEELAGVLSDLGMVPQEAEES